MHSISVRLPSELKAWLDRKADEDGRSLNKQIIHFIKAAKNTSDHKETK